MITVTVGVCNKSCKISRENESVVTSVFFNVLKRCVGVTWLVSHALPIRVHTTTKTCVESIKSTIRHMQKSGRKVDLPWFGYGDQKCMFTDFFHGFVGPPNCAHY